MGFWQDLTGDTAADAARAAAADTYSKQKKATDDLIGYGDTYANAFKGLSTQFAPYADAGGSALTRLMQGLGLGGEGGSQEFADAYRALPGYGAGIETGSRAITGNAAARGMLNSGATLKGLQRFGSDYEDKRSTDYLSRLMGLSGMGQTATGQQVATEGQGLQGQLGTRTSAYGGQMQSAGTTGQGDIAAANAQAAGSQNLMNTGVKLAGMAMGGGFGGLGGLMGTSAGNIGGTGLPGFGGLY